MKKIILSVIIILLTISSYGQVKKYGKVSKEALESKSDAVFKDANAIVLFKKRRTEYQYDGENGFSLVTKVHERIKLFNKEGFKNATVRIPYYVGGNSEESVIVKAATYQLNGKKVVKTKLSKKDVFKKEDSKFWSSKSFTMPNLTEGCIVEWEYEIKSPFFTNLNDIVFQKDIPVKYYDARINIPEYFIYKTEACKYYMVPVNKTKKDRKIDYSYRENNLLSTDTSHSTNRRTGTLNFTENIYNVELKNVEPLKEEPFINNLDNYRGKIEFELSSIHYPNSPYKNYASNWNDVTKTIYESSRFGGELKKTSHFKNDLKEILTNASTRDDKISAIFSFVKHKIKWNGYNSYFTHNGVKKAYKDGVGNVAEINLTLITMLREAGFDANPILVSTRSNGVPIFSTRDGFNYVIAGVELPNQLVLLDATDVYSLPNVLPTRVLNWQGRIIRSYGSSAFISLFPKKYSFENNRLNVKIKEDGLIEGSLRVTYKNSKTISYRNRLNKLNEESLIKSLEEKYNPIEIEKARLGNKEKLGKPFVTSIKFSAENQLEEISGKLYFSPLFFLQDKENYFKQDNRKYPIDFASPWLDDFDIVIQIPEGYKVDKLPESTQINTESGNLEFSYTSEVKGTNIMLKVTTKVNVPIIAYNAYQELKDFFNAKILKENEKIVLVKE